MNPHFDELELYLDDLLPPIRKAAFEALMETDKELRDAVESEREYRAAQSILAQEVRRKSLAQINADAVPGQQKKKQLSWGCYAIVAILLGLGGLLYWFMIQRFS